jgi:hypothetical protein
MKTVKPWSEQSPPISLVSVWSGRLEGSFIPPSRQRELRDLSRHRAPLVEEKTRISNRIEKVWEDANIKLGSVASEVMGFPVVP